MHGHRVCFTLTRRILPTRGPACEKKCAQGAMGGSQASGTHHVPVAVNLPTAKSLRPFSLKPQSAGCYCPSTNVQ